MHYENTINKLLFNVNSVKLNAAKMIVDINQDMGKSVHV